MAALFCNGHLTADELVVPQVTDPKLQISLLAREPEIVTPTGLAADRQGRLYVVESHTHARGRQYEGPEHDRIIVFEDTDGDGQLDRSRVYAGGLRHALAIAFSADDQLYVVQMKSVVVVKDIDGDGVCEATQPVLTVQTANNNNHGVFLGLAFDEQNRLYVSLGNIGGNAYTISGTDGLRVAGQGDTGLIVRCQADGASLERFAHGFWNPCDLKFDWSGRLLATDNDPDARGPNRVLHVIQGGEYGYQSRFGGSGRHPYCAWNGELPGTLPMLAGVGEAPVGLLDCNAASLPADYVNDLLVCVWGTNQVVRVRTGRRGASLEGQVEPLVIGDANFRPTAITTTSDGTIYIADWVNRQYPVHGQGRIWRLAAKPQVKTLSPRASFSRVDDSAGQRQMAQLRQSRSEEAFPQLVAAAVDDDPFIASTAISSLGQPLFRERVTRLLDKKLATHRRAGLLALRRAKVELDKTRFRQLLRDADPTNRKMAMIWAGETMRIDLAEELKKTLPLQSSSADLFETFLATSQLLTQAELARVEAKTPGNRIDRRMDQDLIESILVDEAQSTSAKAMAIRYLTDFDTGQLLGKLSNLAHSQDPKLAVEAIRTLAAAHDESAAQLLAAIARDAHREESVRCEAIMAYVTTDAPDFDRLFPLIDDENPRVALAAVRGLTKYAQAESVRGKFSAALAAPAAAPYRPERREQLQFALAPTTTQRPQSVEQWRTVLQREGDAEAGRRICFDSRSMCSKCHSVHGRGGRVGPDLSNVAAAKNRDQLLVSVLDPSQDKSPDYQGYIVLMDDGRVFKGTQFHFRGESAEIQREDGKRIRFRLDETEDYRALDKSLMPEKLEETMSVSEFRDLFAYLISLRDAR